MSGAPKYILTERIAQGGMAEIHLGKSVGLDGFARVCAFKRILPHYAQDQEFIQMFRNEAMVAKQLQNKNIVQVFDFVSDGTSFMLVMEFVDGQDLRSVLAASEQQRKRIPPEIACYLAIECLSGLGYAHGAVDVSGRSMGIIHRDVSPQNILISYEGDVKITDFGIAKAQNQNSTTRAGVLKGKFRYMSPEQALGETIDARSDIFAVGVILWEMLTMQRLFKGEDMAVLEAVRQCRIKAPSQSGGTKAHPELDAIVMKLLAKDVSKRYQNAKEAIRDLNKFVYGIRADFFAGEAAEFMHHLFRDKLAAARERLRSTLALPVGALGGGSAFDLFGASDPAATPSSVVDMSKPSQKAVPAAVPMAGAAARAMGGAGGGGGGAAAPNLDDLMKEGAPRRGDGGGGGVQRIEVVGGRPAGGQSTGRQRPGSPRSPQMAKPRLRSTRMNGPRMGVDPSSEGMGGETLLLMGVLFVVGLLAGYLALLKLGVISRASDLVVEVTPGGGRFTAAFDGKPLGGGKYMESPIRLGLQGNKEHVLTIRKLGFKDRSFQVKTPLFGGPLKESLILEKGTTPLASLRIITTPPGANVVLEEGLDDGATPVSFPFLPVGRTYEVRIRHPKCPSAIKDRIRLKPGDERIGLVAKTYRLKGCLK